MNYADYKDVRDMSWKILIDCQITELPVRISDVCRQLGVTIHRFTPQNAESDGMSIIAGGVPHIFVSRACSIQRQRFTAAHELGHVILGHLGKYELVNREPSPQDNPVERSANVFAARILAPACVLWGCGASSPEEIASLCNISRPAAEFRAQRMELLRQRGRFLTSPLETQVYTQFLPYINEHRL